ncbi:hypothetical protein LTR74_004206 [Friedmanniomyces endolithicus]|nr:hypothetical protein LTR74_004206 [Friedmanniomyces endolithicus]
MGATYSQCLAWRRILQVLVVLFATVAQSREFVQDIGLNGLQTLNSTSPAVIVYPKPYAKTPNPGPDYYAYHDAISKGGCHLRMMATGSASQSIFTDRDSLFDNGWVDTFAHNELQDAPPSIDGSRGDDLHEEVIAVLHDLQMDLAESQLHYYWTQSRQGGPGYTQTEYGQAGTSDYFATHTRYGITKANYENQFNTVSGLLLSVLNYSPAFMVKEYGFPGPPPPLNRLSDVLWFQWVDACQTSGQSVGNIRYFFRHRIADSISTSIMNFVDTIPGEEVREYPGKDYYMDAEDQNGEIAKAFLGSSNGHAVAFFLAQHEHLIGKRLTVEKVRWWDDGWDEFGKSFLFYVVEVPEADDALTPTPS